MEGRAGRAGNPGRSGRCGRGGDALPAMERSIRGDAPGLQAPGAVLAHPAAPDGCSIRDGFAVRRVSSVPRETTQPRQDRYGDVVAPGDAGERRGNLQLQAAPAWNVTPGDSQLPVRLGVDGRPLPPGCTWAPGCGRKARTGDVVPAPRSARTWRLTGKDAGKRLRIVPAEPGDGRKLVAALAARTPPRWSGARAIVQALVRAGHRPSLIPVARFRYLRGLGVAGEDARFDAGRRWTRRVLGRAIGIRAAVAAILRECGGVERKA